VFFGKRRSDARLEPAFHALTSVWKLRIRTAPRTLTAANMEPFPTKRISKCIRGILPCHMSAYPAATPPSRPAKRVGIYTAHVRVVPSQAERRNAKHSLAHPCACPECAYRVHLSRKSEIREFIRRLAEPCFCVPSGDAVIAACQARA